MQVGNVTTPFGRRPMTRAMLAGQISGQAIEDGASVDKWKLYRALCEARPKLGIGDRALSLLNALLTFFPKNELAAGDNLIVFPSNAQLSLRAHGMAEPTIRRHIAALVEAGLLIRKDSANGKRFARRSNGEIGEAFGFSLAPLLARAAEIDRLASEVVAERQLLQGLKERLTICRRDIVKLIETALDEGVPANWQAMYDRYQAFSAALPRQLDAETAARHLDNMEALREEILMLMENHIFSQNTNGNPDHSERHIQNSNPDLPHELEPRFEKRQGEMSEDDIGGDTARRPTGHENDDVLPMRNTGYRDRRVVGDHSDGLKPFPLGMVLSACPDISDYGPGGSISSWRELMSAAIVVRSMLGVSPSAYEQACAILGPENAATVIACILQRAGHINSAGGYLRDLTRKAERGEFSLGPMIMAQIRTNGPVAKRRA